MKKPPNTQQQESNQESSETKPKKRPFDGLRYLLLTGLLGGLFLHTFIKAGLMNQTLGFIMPPATAIPSLKSDGGFTPDWSNVKFEDMIFSEGGNVSYPGKQGGTETRTWEAGESLAQIMEFGDFSDAGLGLEEISLEYVADKLGLDLDGFSLADFELMEWQTPLDLVNAIPQLEGIEANKVPPIQDFFKEMGINQGNDTIGEILSDNPDVEDIPIAEKIQLDDYSITEIPGLETTQVQDFGNWDDTLIGGVPGLNELPWSEFPQILTPTLAFVGQVDLPLMEVEANRTRTISGSYQEGFNVPCLQDDCAHMEISGPGQTTGVEWISGKFQKVKGGFGPLKAVFGGKEPTGRHPFGEAFKQVVWNINEAEGSVETTMFFRICKKIPFVGKTCTPYGIGPVPFITYQEKDPIILGSPSTLPE
ncbi:MAG: hypothetical protein AAF378_00720 [Cyanobacteria bacterium P01_A01_bin.84]